jgi:hypothetical protein
MPILRWLRRKIEKLGPYQSLILIALPLAVVEPLKLVTVFLAGSGHWMTATIAIIVAYAMSLLIVERLFKIVKPKLLTLRWFAASWRWYAGIRAKALKWLRITWSSGRRALRATAR